jgi:hypothetical protein
MNYYAQIEAEIREHLLRVIEIVRPYARSTGRFHNREDLRTAISSATVSLERAEFLADHKLPP